MPDYIKLWYDFICTIVTNYLCPTFVTDKVKIWVNLFYSGKNNLNLKKDILPALNPFLEAIPPIIQIQEAAQVQVTQKIQKIESLLWFTKTFAPPMPIHSVNENVIFSVKNLWYNTLLMDKLSETPVFIEALNQNHKLALDFFSANLNVIRAFEIAEGPLNQKLEESIGIAWESQTKWKEFLNQLKENNHISTKFIRQNYLHIFIEQYLCMDNGSIQLIEHALEENSYLGPKNKFYTSPFVFKWDALQNQSTFLMKQGIVNHVTSQMAYQNIYLEGIETISKTLPLLDATYRIVE